MASPRTLKRRKQRKDAIKRRADQARWNALTDEQKQAEDIVRYTFEKMLDNMMLSSLRNLQRQTDALAKIHRNYSWVEVEGAKIEETIQVRRPIRMKLLPAIVTDTN